MRRTSLRLADNGSGPHILDHYPLAFAQDDEGNPVRQAPPPFPNRYFGIVQPANAVGGDMNGMEMSITTYSIVIFSKADPGVMIEDRVDWRGVTLRALGDAARHVVGAWKFEAAERGPAPAVQPAT